ncbi:MAG: carbonate dehydratase [Bacteroidales bacterium]
MEQHWALLKRNREWAEKVMAEDPEFFKRLVKKQDPEWFIIGCSDSRMPLEVITGSKPGEIFVHRNVANVVNNNDLNFSAALCFAVTRLKVKHIVVCGHTHCGGINAALSDNDFGIMNPWLKNIRDFYAEVYSSHGRLDKDEFTRKHVLKQCANLLTYPEVQKSITSSGTPLIHGWLYHLENGRIEDLEFDNASALKHARRFYPFSTQEDEKKNATD